MVTPRPYQKEIVSRVCAGWKDFRKQLVVAPTGSGKTCVFSWLAEKTPGRTLILCHRNELIDQAIAKLHAATGIEASREKAESFGSRDAKVVVASVQTLMREQRRELWSPDHFSLVIVDEAHHALAASYRSVLNHFDGHARVLGVTATPDRGDKRNLGEYFENVAAEVGLFDLIDDGYLSPITLKAIPLKIDLSSVRQTAGDFNEADLGSALEPYLDQIARAIREHASFRRVLAFLPLIATSQKFVEACRAAGLKAEHIDGTSEDRKDKLTRFAEWDFDVLSNAMLLTEGYDDPGIDCVVCLRPTRSRPLYAQMVGRGTRIHETKSNLLLLDFLWHHEKHQLCRPAHLIAETQEEADTITELAQDRAGLPADVAAECELDLQDLAGAATAKREESLRKKLEEHRHKKGRVMSAEEFALEHHDLATAEFEPTMKWESNEVTEKQAKVLKRAHIDLATVRGRGHASKLISLIFRNQKLTLASPKQQALMRRMGHNDPANATQDEARRFFKELRNTVK